MAGADNAKLILQVEAATELAKRNRQAYRLSGL
jgi:hypothetical protein